jgi:hypothetical protein
MLRIVRIFFVNVNGVLGQLIIIYSHFILVQLSQTLFIRTRIFFFIIVTRLNLYD